MLLPLQGDFDISPYTQGNALGYVHFGLSDRVSSLQSVSLDSSYFNDDLPLSLSSADQKGKRLSPSTSQWVKPISRDFSSERTK